MNIIVKSNGFEKQSVLLKRCIDERISVEYKEGGMTIELLTDAELGKKDSYLITGDGDDWKITGSDERGLFYGIGKFLHSAKWDSKGFVPNPPKDVVSPDCSFRAIYLANHFNNWYQEAPEEELQKYIEELLLWGYNAIISILPVIHFGSKEDPEFLATAATSRAVLKAAKNCGMGVGITVNPNQGMTSAPEEFDAVPPYDPMAMRPKLGRNLCASNPDAVEYLRGVWDIMFETYTDIGLDYIVPWPYDEGGCGCEKCRPWGARGFANLIIEVNKEVKKYYPECKIVGCTWYFDLPEEGEFEGFYERLKTDLDFVDYVMADSYDTFPEYPLEHEVIKPVVSFPEISMWKLYPWGGRGANPQPKRFQRIWNSAKAVLDGGMPYSEGIFEDILKVQLVGYFWDKNRHYRDILSEYISYEYSKDVCKEVLEMMEHIETNHVLIGSMLHAPALPIAQRAAELADMVDAKLDDKRKQSWRWRILYIRAQIDKILYEYYYDNFAKPDEQITGGFKRDRMAIYNLHKTPIEYLAHSDKAQELMHELIDIYHCIKGPIEYKRVYPPIRERMVKKEVKGVITYENE